MRILHVTKLLRLQTSPHSRANSSKTGKVVLAVVPKAKRTRTITHQQFSYETYQAHYIFYGQVSSAAWAQNPDRSAPPALSTVKDLQLPLIQRSELSNGLKVVLMEKHSVPLVQVNLLIRAGSINDPQGKEGLASFTMDMLGRRCR